MSRSYVANAASERQVRAAKSAERIVHERRHAALRALLSDDNGLLVLWWLLELCGLFQANEEFSARVYFLNGMKKVGLMLLAAINEADPDGFERMQQRHKRFETEIQALLAPSKPEKPRTGEPFEEFDDGN